MKEDIRGYCQLAAAQICIGINIVALKIMIPQMPMTVLLAIRFALGSLFLTSFILLSPRRQVLLQAGRSISRHSFLTLFLQAVCGGFLFNVLMVTGLHYTSATAAGIISSATPAIILLFSWLILGELLSFKKVFTVGFAILGLVIINLAEPASADATHALWGNLLILLAMVPEALFTIFGKLYRQQVAPTLAALMINLINALLFFPLALESLANHATRHLDSASMSLIVLYGASGAFFFMFWHRGLAQTKASTAALFTCLMPIITAIFAWIFLGEHLTWYHAVGMVCVLSSIAIGALPLKDMALKLPFPRREMA